MFDKNEAKNYTQSVDLDNEISEVEMPVLKGDTYMGRQKVHVTLPSGEPVWITGSTFSELIQNALAKYGAPRQSISGDSETFKEYTDNIFDVFLKPRWKPSTAETNKFLLDKHILPYFAQMDISKIDTASIQRFFQTKQHLSKSYTKQMLIMLHEIFENAVEDKKISSDPTDSKRITLPQKKSEREALTFKQFNKIVSSLNKLKAEDRLLMAFLCFTGMRRGEILGLKWECISDESIYVCAEITFKSNAAIFNEYTKSKYGIRYIPIAKELVPYLEKKRKGFVFGGDTPYTQSKFNRTWQRIARTIEIYGATPHIFRHTYLSLLAASNVDPKTIQAIAGHSDFSFTFNKYISKNQTNIQNASEMFSKYISKNSDSSESESDTLSS